VPHAEAARQLLEQLADIGQLTRVKRTLHPNPHGKFIG
jgi:hypothetical protein